jgi:hypothetical protein
MLLDFSGLMRISVAKMVIWVEATFSKKFFLKMDMANHQDCETWYSHCCSAQRSINNNRRLSPLHFPATMQPCHARLSTQDKNLEDGRQSIHQQGDKRRKGVISACWKHERMSFWGEDKIRWVGLELATIHPSQ